MAACPLVLAGPPLAHVLYGAEVEAPSPSLHGVTPWRCTLQATLGGLSIYISGLQRA